MNDTLVIWTTSFTAATPQLVIITKINSATDNYFFTSNNLKNAQM
jgi:hypothetical protein